MGRHHYSEREGLARVYRPECHLKRSIGPCQLTKKLHILKMAVFDFSSEVYINADTLWPFHDRIQSFHVGNVCGILPWYNGFYRDIVL